MLGRWRQKRKAQPPLLDRPWLDDEARIAASTAVIAMLAGLPPDQARNYAIRHAWRAAAEPATNHIGYLSLHVETRGSQLRALAWVPRDEIIEHEQPDADP
jgi:hypothetical protein